MSDNDLSGEIPPEMANLANLTEVYISGNRLTGCYPAVWKLADNSDLAESGLASCAAPTPLRVKAALTAFYNAANGDGWANSDNWLTDAPIENWRGVSVDGDEFITGDELLTLWLGEQRLERRDPDRTGEPAQPPGFVFARQRPERRNPD